MTYMFVKDSDDEQATTLDRSVLQNITCSASQCVIWVTNITYEHRYGARCDEARRRRSELYFLPTLFRQHTSCCGLTLHLREGQNSADRTC